jgi:hypothetical protein
LTIHFNTSIEAFPLIAKNPHVKVTADLGMMRAIINRCGAFIDLNNIPESYEDEHRPIINKNRIEIMLDYLDISGLAVPELFMTKGLETFGKKFVKGCKRPFMGIAPMSRRKEKMWPMERWRELVTEWKRETGGAVFVFHSRKIPDLEGSAVTHTAIDLMATVSVALQMDIFVTLDSLWTHVAAALRIPQVLLASCTDGELLSKTYPSTYVLHGQEPCYPCWYMFAAGGCQLGQHPKCLSGISGMDAYVAVQGVLNGQKTEAA